MIPKVADIVIIGSGAMGLATAYWLTRRECKNIVVLEKKDHIGGSTTQLCGGGIRSQFSTPINITMSLLSLSLLQTLQEDCGNLINFHQSGYAFLLTEQSEVQSLRQAVDLQHSFRIDTKWLTQQDIQTLFPYISDEDILAGTFYDKDGWIDPDELITSYLRVLQEQGVTFLPSTPATDIYTENGRVCSVATPYGTIFTHSIVNATGPWAAEIASLVHVQLPIRQVCHQSFTCVPNTYAVSHDFPTLIFPAKNIGFRYEYPGILVGSTAWNDGDQAPLLNIDPSLETHTYALAARYLPFLEQAPIVSRKVGFYDVTADLHPILGQTPYIRNFYTIAGFSGHGFMHSLASGLLLSEEILDGRAHTLNIDPLRLERFQRQNITNTECQVL